MYESRHQKPLSRRQFVQRVFNHVLAVAPALHRFHWREDRG